ncbi:MAG TPA: hypothetical protein VGK35_14045 [Actinotalea sp.]|jgi:hypothetical protein
MPADDRSTESATWHAALRLNDDAAHAREDEWMRAEAVRVLELRLTQANADRHALRAGLHLRNTLLDEQRVALAERDSVISRQARALEAAGGPGILRRARAAAGRTFIGDIYRSAARAVRRQG